MNSKLSKFIGFISTNRVPVIMTVVVLSLIAVLVLIRGCSPEGVNEQVSTLSTEATAATVETQAAPPLLYPEEIFQFQLPDIDTEYLQTDIFTTVDNNIFMDSLVYTGYNITKHRQDGRMWEYILSADKRGLGYLSGVSYGGGSSGYETNADGKPDIAYFEKGNLVCASYVTYVIFNYLPNVAGIDTSALTRPEKSVSAHSFYLAAQDWVNKGYCEYIGFDYQVLGPIGNGFIEFQSDEEIPIGSLVILCNPRESMSAGSHVTIYAGHVNGYDWLYHVGTKNGPEMTAIQRMNFGPNARWPLAVITPPNNICYTPVLEIELVDKTGAPIVGSEFILKHPTSGKEISLGCTDENGKLIREDLSYGDFELVQIVPEGYSCQKTENEIKISSVNNSHNKIFIVNTKLPS